VTSDMTLDIIRSSPRVEEAPMVEVMT